MALPTLDTPHPSVVSLVFQGNVTDDELAVALAELGRVIAKLDRFAAIVDATRVTATSATRRRAMTEWLRRHDGILRRRCAGAAFVLRSGLQHGVLTALLWVAPQPFEILTTTSLSDAHRWALARAGESGAGRPSLAPARLAQILGRLSGLKEPGAPASKTR